MNKSIRFDSDKFKPPFRLSISNEIVVLDSNNKEVVAFKDGNIKQAQLYLEYLNQESELETTFFTLLMGYVKEIKKANATLVGYGLCPPDLIEFERKFEFLLGLSDTPHSNPEPRKTTIDEFVNKWSKFWFFHQNRSSISNGFETELKELVSKNES